MKRITALKWFTLLEMMIVMIIVWILAVVLTESYTTISRTALKIEQEKNLSEESLVLTQVFQSISDEATIDFDAYRDRGIDLATTSWFTDKLFLTWWEWSDTSIYTTWESCLDLDHNFPVNSDGTYPDYSQVVRNSLTWCELILQQWEEKTSLISNWKVITSKVKFRIIPFDSDKNYFIPEEGWFVLNKVHQPAFWMFIHLYAPFYQPTGTNKIDQPLQLFFNLNL